MMRSPDEKVSRPLHWGVRLLPLALLATVLAAGFVLGWHRYLTLDQLAVARTTLQAFAAAQGIVAMVAYVLAYAIAVAVAFPATWLLTLTGGFLYGIVVGGLLSTIGATLGATVLFWAAKTAFGDGLRKRVEGFAGKAAEGFEKNAFSYVLALRLAPLLPFSVVNILPALFKVPIGTFVAATLLGVLPGTVVYSSIGQGLDIVLERANNTGEPIGIGDLVTPQITFGFMGMALLAALVPLSKFLQRRRKSAGR